MLGACEERGVGSIPRLRRGRLPTAGQNECRRRRWRQQRQRPTPQPERRRGGGPPFISLARVPFPPWQVCDLLGMDGVAWAKANNVALVGTWHSNYCDYIKFYSAAWWLVPVLRRYIQQFYGAIPTTFVPTDYMRLKLTAEGYDRFTDMQIWGRGIDLEVSAACLRRAHRSVGAAALTFVPRSSLA